MYTAARPPTPAHNPTLNTEPCIDSGTLTFLAETEHKSEETVAQEKPTVNSGRILIGRWSRRKCDAPSGGDPPEVVVLQAPLHTRPPRQPPTSQAQPSAKRSRPKTSKKTEKKFIKQPFKIVIDEESESIRDDGRIIASKVLPIMAMLLQRNECDEDEEPKPPEEQPKKCFQPKLSVQCIQLLPSEPTSSRKH